MAKDLTFIVSGGRTGTQFLGDRLGMVIEDCYSEHEPDIITGSDLRRDLAHIRRFGLWQTVIGKSLGLTGVRVIGERVMKGTMSEAEAIQRLRAARARYHARIPQSLVIESYYAWWRLVDLIPRIWPDARIIGIIRNKDDWVASCQRHQPRRGSADQLAREWDKIAEMIQRPDVRLFRFEEIFGPDASHMRALVEYAAGGRQIGDLSGFTRTRVNASV